jgi:predicted P-loop ATPase
MPEAEGQLAPAPAKEDLPGWYKLLLLTDKGLPRATAGNALTIFENEPDLGVLAFDNFRDQLTIFRRPPWEAKALGVSYPRAVSDTDSTRAGQWIERAYRVAFQGRMLADTIEAAARRNAFDPLVEYIHGLEWDGLPRLRTWLADFFGAEQTVYTAEVGRRWMISAVARGLCKSASGIQADHVLVFEGPQGARKSSGLRALAGEFFTDEVPDLTTKDAAISLSGVWLVELSELESLRRADVQKTKAWISRRVDRYRPPYGRATVARPRRCVFAATTNDQAYLKDWSGNRRWWPVACGAVDVVSLQDCRDQLWAEAAAAYKAGEPWWLDSDELNAAASEAQISRAEIDPWEEPISDYVAGRRYVTTGDILENLQIERGRADKLHSRRIAEILRRLGLSRRERHRVGDAREYRYSRPPE